MTYSVIATSLIAAEQIKEDSAVRMIGETQEEVMYSKSAYDACREACGDDDSLFQIVYLMYTGNKTRALAWAIVQLKNSQ